MIVSIEESEIEDLLKYAEDFINKIENIVKRLEVNKEG